MNKAFVKESEDDDDELAGVLPQIPAGAKNYITPAGYQRIREELLHLIDVDRPEVVRIVHWAASNGDRSENGDYIYGKRRLREIDRRIRFLTKRMDLAEVVDPTVLIQKLKPLNITFVLYGSELSVPLADRLAKALCPQYANNEDTSLARSDKCAMMQALKKHNMPIVKEVVINLASLLKQKELCGLGDIDYKNVYKNNINGFTTAKYVSSQDLQNEVLLPFLQQVD